MIQPPPLSQSNQSQSNQSAGRSQTNSDASNSNGTPRSDYGQTPYGQTPQSNFNGASGVNRTEAANGLLPSGLASSQPQTSGSSKPAQLPQQRELSLRRQLVQTVLPTVMVPLAVAGVAGYKFVQASVEDQTSTTIRDQALLAGAGIQGLLRDVAVIPAMVADSSVVIESAKNGAIQAQYSGLEQLSREQLEERFQATKLLAPNQELNDYLRRTAERVGLAELVITERNGFNIAYSQPVSGFVQTNEAWWQNAASQTEWVSQPVLDERTGTFGVEFSQAIRDPQSGDFLGVVKAQLPSDRFRQIAETRLLSGLTGSQSVQLVEATSGTVLQTATADGIAEAQALRGGEVVRQAALRVVQAMQSNADPNRVRADLESQFAIQQVEVMSVASGTATGVLSASFVYDGFRYYLSSVPDSSWVAIASANQSELGGAGQQLVLLFALLTLAMGGVAIAILLRLARQISAPIFYLSSAAEQVASGDLDVVTLPCGTRETQTLSHTFNTLVARVKTFLNDEMVASEKAKLLAQLTGGRALNEAELNSTFTQALHSTRSLLGVDRVVIYRFKADWSGYISHESVGNGWVKAIHDRIEDPCIPQHILDDYQKDRVVPTADVWHAGFHPDHLNLMERLQIKANLVVPILHEGQLYGLLIAHHCATAHNWSTPEISFLRQLAAQFGVMLDRVSYLQQQESETERSRFLNTMTLQLTQAESSEQILGQIPLAEIREVLNADRVLVYRFDQDWKGTVTDESVAKGLPQAKGAEIYDPCFTGYIEKYQQGRVHAIADIHAADLTPCYLQQLEPFAVRANLVAPINQGKQLIGLLIAHQCDRPRHWQPRDIAFFRQISLQIGLLLNRAHLLQQREDETERSRLLNTMTLELTQAESSEEVLTHVPLAEIRTALAADRVLVYRFDKDWKGTITDESVGEGLPKALGAEIYDPCFAKDYVQKYQEGRVQSTPDIHNAGLTPCHLEQLEPFKVKANLVAPIMQGTQLLGLLIAHQCDRPRIWEPRDIAFIKQVSLQVGQALNRASLLQRQEDESGRSRLLNTMTLQLTQTDTADDVLDQVPLASIRDAIRADRVMIYRFDANWQGTITAESVVDGFPRALGASIHDPCFEKDYVQKYRQGRVNATSDIQKAGLTPCHLQQLAPFAVKANLVAPINRGQELLGLLIAHQCDRPRIWESRDIAFFSQVALQVGLALDRADLLHQRDQSANEQQRQRETLQNQLMLLLNDVEGAAQGDLTVRADVTAGEIGTVADFFNSIVESLRQIVSQVKDSAYRVNTSLNRDESSIRQLADEISNQADETTRTLDSVEHMTRSIQSVAASARQAAEFTHKASATAKSGGDAMDRTVQTILSLREAVGETSKKVKRLAESSQQISRVVSIIEKVALQTNLLAINAGIEAARAGEEGQGFAIVAEEVGALASQVAAATQEIDKIVSGIQLGTSDVINAMEESTTHVVDGTRFVEDAKRNLDGILNASHTLDQLVQTISEATVSQLETSKTVSELMRDMAHVSRATSQTSRDVAKSLKQTVEVADELQISVSQFKLV